MFEKTTTPPPPKKKKNDLLKKKLSTPRPFDHQPPSPMSFFFDWKILLMVNCWFGLVVWDSRGTPK